MAWCVWWGGMVGGTEARWRGSGDEMLEGPFGTWDE